MTLLHRHAGRLYFLLPLPVDGEGAGGWGSP